MSQEAGNGAPETYQRTTIANIANGALAEQFQDALLKVLANVDDPNTETKAKRKITIELDLTPDATGRALQVAISVKTKLAAPKEAESTLFIVRDGKGEVFGVNDNVYQPELFKG